MLSGLVVRVFVCRGFGRLEVRAGPLPVQGFRQHGPLDYRRDRLSARSGAASCRGTPPASASSTARPPSAHGHQSANVLAVGATSEGASSAGATGWAVLRKRIEDLRRAHRWPRLTERRSAEQPAGRPALAQEQAGLRARRRSARRRRRDRRHRASGTTIAGAGAGAGVGAGVGRGGGGRGGPRPGVDRALRLRGVLPGRSWKSVTAPAGSERHSQHRPGQHGRWHATIRLARCFHDVCTWTLSTPASGKRRTR